MMRSNRFPAGAVGLLCAAALACADPPTSLRHVEGVSFAKPPGPVQRAASVYWAMGAQYGIQPDERKQSVIDGATYSEFRNGDCGVKAMFNLTNAGDTFFDPDNSWSRRSVCSDGIGVARYADIVYPVATGWASERLAHMYFRRLYFFDNGSSDPIYVNWRNTVTISTSGACGQVWFHEVQYPGSSNVLITRTTVNGVPAFRVESDASKGHLAWCVNRGVAVAVPFVAYVLDLGEA